jgi:hypothetical protein
MSISRRLRDHQYARCRGRVDARMKTSHDVKEPLCFDLFLLGLAGGRLSCSGGLPIEGWWARLGSGRIDEAGGGDGDEERQRQRQAVRRRTGVFVYADGACMEFGRMVQIPLRVMCTSEDNVCT